MAQVSDGGEEEAPDRLTDAEPNAIGVPSAELSLGWLLASRANLRFTRRDGDTASVPRKQVQPKVAGQEGWQKCSLRRAIFCPKNGVHLKLYKCRWQVELFFKWIKQHLRIKGFYGNSPNAVRTQVWISISVYVLVAILKKELKLDRSLSEILQILSITLFEKSPLFTSNSRLVVKPRNFQERRSGRS